jgi:Mn2+/Fe2+ NRAMP family transporter
MTTEKFNWSVLIGAAFLMASSAIGPGFLTQTALFTSQLGASFGFVILVSIIIDAISQLNIWRVITVANKPAQDIANDVVPGMGYVLSALVAMGGFAFNIGSIAGAGLGMNVLFGISVAQGAAIACILAIGIFVFKESGKAMDLFSKCLGTLKIGLAIIVVFLAHPPMAEAVKDSIIPQQFSLVALLTIVGGTVGGYITFTGAHRLLDAGQCGIGNLKSVSKGALSAIGLASLMRILFFLAALGVIAAGGNLNPDNPAASVFQLAAGNIGYKLFGVILLAAGTSSVVGSAFTSISFVRSFHPKIQKYNQQIIIAFIVLSCIVYEIVGKPVKVLVAVGAINGLILPLSLGIMLVAANRQKILTTYKQPLWLTMAGVAVVMTMAWLSVGALSQIFGQ